MIDAGIWFNDFAVSRSECEDSDLEGLDRLVQLLVQVPGVQVNQPEFWSDDILKLRARPSITSI